MNTTSTDSHIFYMLVDSALPVFIFTYKPPDFMEIHSLNSFTWTHSYKQTRPLMQTCVNKQTLIHIHKQIQNAHIHFQLGAVH